MPRGGQREGAGGKLKWKHGKTKQIRVPEALADRLLELTEMLDNGYEVGRLDVLDVGADSNPKILDLSTVSLTAVSGSLAVKLEDISLAGYQILPHNLSVMVEARVQRLKEKRNLSNNGLNKKSKK